GAPVEIRVPRRRRPDDPALRAEGDRRRQAVGSQGVGAPHGPRQEHSGAEAGGGETVPDAGGGRVLDHGARHGGHGADRPGQDQGGGGSGDGGLRDGQEGGGHGGRDVPQAARRGAGGGQRRPAAARGGETDVERGMVLAKPGSITPHTTSEAELHVLTKEEGGSHTPFFKGY